MEEKEIYPEKKQKQPMIKVNSNPNPNLVPECNIPEVLLFSELLPKLPVKSLMRFKCVSKLWRSTISSSDFAKLHLQQSNSKNQNQGFLVQTKSSLYAVSNYTCYDGTENFDVDQLKVRFDHHGLSEGSFDLVDSCNGLICFLLKSESLCVWNPFNQECRAIPEPQHLNHLVFEPSYWAFGYIPSLDDYKLVCINFAIPKNSSGRRVTLTRVYSLRSNKWREVETDNGPFGMYAITPCESGVVLANGKSHWLVRFISLILTNVRILAFDLATETFNEVPLPQDLNGDDKRDLREHACIGSIEEDLSIASQGSGQCLDVWVLKRYGEWESWTKLLKLSGVMSPTTGNMKRLLRLSGVMTPTTGKLEFCTSCWGEEGSKFVMNLNRKVWLYNWSDCSPKWVQLEGSKTCHLRRYVETLVSPFLNEGSQERDLSIAVAIPQNPI